MKVTAMRSLFRACIWVVSLFCAFLAGNLYDAHIRAQIAQTGPTVEEISPILTVGSLGTNTALAHEVYADRVVVNGIDVLQMDQELINYLATRPGVEPADVQRIIDRSRATKMYKIKAPNSAPVTPSPKPQGPDGDKK